jgi:hypothetical protein
MWRELFHGFNCISDGLFYQDNSDLWLCNPWNLEIPQMNRLSPVKKNRMVLDCGGNAEFNKRR